MSRGPGPARRERVDGENEDEAWERGLGEDNGVAWAKWRRVAVKAARRGHAWMSGKRMTSVVAYGVSSGSETCSAFERVMKGFRSMSMRSKEVTCRGGEGKRRKG